MLGDVWEWTSSDFLAYPGFEAFPYPEYSEVFFGAEHKVLRGGAWATRRAHDPPQLPQLGPAPAAPDLRRHPLRQGRLVIAIEVHLDAEAAATMARDVRRGLMTIPKELSPKYFYDERGSVSCSSRSPSSRSTTRPAPSARSSASARARSSPPPATSTTLVELGSGSAAKTRHLLTRCATPAA